MEIKVECSHSPGTEEECREYQTLRCMMCSNNKHAKKTYFKFLDDNNNK